MVKKNTKPTDFARIDYSRVERTGIPEVIFCEGKTPEQVVKIFSMMVAKSGYALATRADHKHLGAIKKLVKKATIFREAKMAVYGGFPLKDKGYVMVVTGGTADNQIAEEAALTLEFLGYNVERLYDVGVAGIHRLLSHEEKLRKALAIITVAGMDGALPSVVAGLVACLVVGVPTHVGYGTGEGGKVALNTMLNSCSPGIAVVNIGNGFGAACVVYKALYRITS